MNAELAKAAARVLVDAQWPEGKMASCLTCAEANIVAEFIEDVIGKRAAAEFIQAHSLGDDEEQDEHAALGVLTKERGIGWVEE